MSIPKALVPVLICALLLAGCAYIVLPEEELNSQANTSKGWSAVATDVSQTAAGDLRIELTLRNETGAWSAMQAAPGKPAVLTGGDGKSTDCEEVAVSTGGHRLAPGFQMRGFTGGTKAEPATQLIYVECAGASAPAGSTLSLDYSYVTGDYNYYDKEATKTSGTLEVQLDEAAKELKYPIAEPVEGLIERPGAKITALNDCLVSSQ
jgi:hypothetical protein